MSIAGVLAWSAIPVGALAGGWAVERTGSVALVYAVSGALVALLALAFSFGPLGHADRYLPAGQSTPTRRDPEARPAHPRRPPQSTGAAAAKPAQPAIRRDQGATGSSSSCSVTPVHR
jgi:hypothetical protein